MENHRNDLYSPKDETRYEMCGAIMDLADRAKHDPAEVRAANIELMRYVHKQAKKQISRREVAERALRTIENLEGQG